ncbi:MAG: hypothetical protein DWQ15_07645 [Proteobacteria bacterium]|nr:MAG: hypothetical protein DWQ15_07645 [Pseudomonadota bacterium]
MRGNENRDESQPAPGPVSSKAMPCAVRFPQSGPQIPAQIMIAHALDWIAAQCVKPITQYPDKSDIENQSQIL